MKVTGIIAEYNPFHNGHLHHMQMARRQSGCDYIIAVMSPDFVQRGIPAFLDKWVRARMALDAGADLVLELPIRHAAGSAEYFAKGGVSLLSSLGVVDALSFGCETGRIESLMEYARFLSKEEPEPYKALLQRFLKEGASFARARYLAWLTFSGTQDPHGLLHSPNDILAIEYLRAIFQMKSPLQPIPILRSGAGYHDLQLNPAAPRLSGLNPSGTSLPEDASGVQKIAPDVAEDTHPALFSSPVPDYASAAGIRHALSLGLDVSSQMPPAAFRLLSGELSQNRYLMPSDLDLPLHLKLYEKKASLTDYLDVSEDLARRITHLLPRYTGFEQFTTLLKTKQVTRTRVQRALLHILLGMKAPSGHPDSRIPDYARVLGFRRAALPLLHEIKKHSAIPLITRLPAEKQAPHGLKEDLDAVCLWEVLVSKKTGAPVRNERQRQMIILP